jgi:hypothetical protein
VLRPLAVLALALTALACNPMKLNKGRCYQDTDCDRNAERCNKTTRTCVPKSDGAVPDGDAGDAGDDGDTRDDADARDAFNCDRCTGGGVCDIDANRCVECYSSSHCSADGGARVCDIDANRCVECYSSSHCADGGAKVCDVAANKCVECMENSDCVARSATTPICQSQMCRACRTDNECPAPNICMTDGHCAGGTEVIFVEFSSSGCPDANGSTDKPYCAPADAVSKLMSGKNVIVIRGPTADRLTLNTTGVMPVVVGRPGAGNTAPSIPATAATAIQVLSDSVLIRDLAVNGGTAATSKGVVASGSSALKLVNVRVNLTTGLGVQVDTGAELKMNRCTIENNSRGGVQLGTLNFDITNTVIAKNGPGMDSGGVTWGGLRVSPSGTVPATTRFVNNTVVQNNAVGISCTTDVPIVGSIAYGNVTGQSAGCTIVDCCTGDPLLSSTYRLMSGSPCLDKIDATMSLPDDIDGQARPTNLKSDCGADEL